MLGARRAPLAVHSLCPYFAVRVQVPPMVVVGVAFIAFKLSPVAWFMPLLVWTQAVVPFHPRVTTPEVSVSVIRALLGCLKTISVGPEAFALSTLSTVPRITIACDKMSWRFAPTADKYFATTSCAVGNTRFG